MEKLKHTKGEWEASQENMRASKYWWQIRTGMGAVICNTPDNSSEAEANAKLIAAAPDLLEACLEALKYHQGGHSEIGLKLKEVIKKAIQ